MKLISLLSILTLATMLSSCSEKQTDKSDFQVYLCFGQSNMAGAAKAEAQDSVVDQRFKVMSAMDCPDLNRETGTKRRSHQRHSFASGRIQSQ